MLFIQLSGWLVEKGEVGAKFIVEVGLGGRGREGREEVVEEGVGEEDLRRGGGGGDTFQMFRCCLYHIFFLNQRKMKQRTNMVEGEGKGEREGEKEEFWIPTATKVASSRRLWHR